MIQTNGILFEAVQNPGIFEDSKSFVDAIPKIDEKMIEEEYKLKRHEKNFRLESFLRKHFIFPHMANSPKSKIDTSSLDNYVKSMWNVLIRQPVKEKNNDTLIALPNPFIVPGGRFRETYYWDNYFTAEGLASIGHFEIIESIVKNTIYLQKKIGLIPNGNRTYYVTRSQAPVLGLLIHLLEKHYGFDHIADYIPALEVEYKFWMNGHKNLSFENPCYRRVVLMPDGSLLNRYYDDADTPRPESFSEDVALTHNLSEKDAKTLYRNLRAACESGWDFTSRWLAKPNDLLSIQTTDIIPVDLNAFLYQLEIQLAHYCNQLGDIEKSEQYQLAANNRKKAINQWLWNDQENFYFDFNRKLEKRTDIFSLAATTPLFVNLASNNQAKQVAHKIEKDFLKLGGLISTTIESGQQWDSPNGWAPLQWLAVKGLLNYNFNKLAVSIMQRFLKTAHINFYRYNTVLEKYNVCNLSKFAGGGEYRAQTGFGWTNGIILKFQALLQSEKLKSFSKKYTSPEVTAQGKETATTTIINNYFFQGNQTKHHFTNREAQCLIGILGGKTAGEVASEIGISSKTAEQYIDKVKKKLGCYSRSQIFKKATETGLLNILMTEEVFVAY